MQPQPQQRKRKHSMHPNKDHNMNSCWRAPPLPPPPPPPPAATTTTTQPPPPLPLPLPPPSLPPAPHLTPNNQLFKSSTVRSTNPHWPHYSPHPPCSPPVFFVEPRTGTQAFKPTLHDCPSSCPEVSVPHSATWQMWPSMAESWEPSGGSLCLRMLFVFLVIHACQECPLWPKPSDFSVFSPWNDVFSG